MKELTIDQVKEVCEEGLVLQGCGGEPQEWLDGINQLFTKEGILQNGTTFQEVSKFEHEGVTNLIFNLNEVEISIEKLAMWRIATHENFGGTWLSDYLPNQLGVEMKSVPEEAKGKPDCEIIGQKGNIYHLMGVASKTLKQHGLRQEAKEMVERIQESSSYHHALNIIGEYVNITAPEDQNEDLELQSYE